MTVEFDFHQGNTPKVSKYPPEIQGGGATTQSVTKKRMLVSRVSIIVQFLQNYGPKLRKRHSGPEFWRACKMHARCTLAPHSVHRPYASERTQDSGLSQTTKGASVRGHACDVINLRRGGVGLQLLWLQGYLAHKKVPPPRTLQ